MYKLKVSLFVIVCGLFYISEMRAQKLIGELTKDRTVSFNIGPSEKHQYTVSLEKDQFVFFRLLQKGADLLVTTYDPKGEKIEEFDSPNGKYGLELFSITSGEKGNYMIEVSHVEKNEPAGDYELKIQLTKPKAISPTEHVDELFAAWNNNESPGCAIAIIKNGAVVHRNNFGMANLEHNIPISSTTVFDVASLSKQFTGFAISTLIEQGKISLSDDIRTYIPELPEFEHTITIDHLIHHTSGLRDWATTIFLQGFKMDDVVTFEQIMEMLYHQKELNFVPGSEYSYSNSGYLVLAEIVQRVTGNTFREWTNANIFQPLEMTNTYFQDNYNELIPNRATGYIFIDNNIRINTNSTSAFGSSSLQTTMDDFIKWVTFLHHPKMSNDPIIQRMFQKGKLNNGDENTYAFGIGLGDYHGMQKIAHNGSWAGFRTFSGYIVDEQLSVVLFSNDGALNSSKMAAKVFDIYLKDIIEKEAKAEAMINEKLDDKPEEIPFDKSSVNLSEYVFVIVDEKLVAKHLRMENIELSPENKDAFIGNEWFFRQIVFERDSENRITGCKVSSGRVKNLSFSIVK